MCDTMRNLIDNWVLSYDFPSVVRMRGGPLIGLLNIFATYGVLVTLLVWSFAFEKPETYLAHSSPEGVVITKMYGVTYLNTTDPSELSVHRIWDNADYTVPPKENGAFTIITSIQVTPKQSQGRCEEDPSIEAARCETRTCVPNKPIRNGNGIMTGKCIDSTIEPGAKVCEILAWCPVEINDKSKRVPLAMKDFTVLIINDVQFPEFGMRRQNIPDDMTKKERDTCLYDPNHSRNKHCPVFSVDTIAFEAGVNFEDVAAKGGAIEIVISWECEYDENEPCMPTYRFTHLDNVSQNLSRGFHMRFADHWISENGTALRTLYRAYGIRVITDVQGNAYKFDFFKMVKTFGSLFTYLFVSKILVRVFFSCYGRIINEENHCDNYKHWSRAEYLATTCISMDEAFLPERSRRRRRMDEAISERSEERCPMVDARSYRAVNN